MSFLLRRTCARVVLLDQHDRVLLIRAHDPARPHDGSWLELPGGGIEEWETSAETCVRELREEAGYGGAEIGPVVWTQRCRFHFAGWRFDQVEHIHLARLSPRLGEHTIEPTDREAFEVLAFESVEWWSTDDLRASPVRTLPPWLAAELTSIAGSGLPSAPRDLTDPTTWEF